MRESVAKFTRHYESARFGGSAEDAQRLPDLYEEDFDSGSPLKLDVQVNESI